MRTNVVFLLVCSACGVTLEIESELGASHRPGDGTPRLPTGADNLRMGSIQVRPCSKCVEPTRQAARAIAEGLKTLTATPQEDGA